MFDEKKYRVLVWKARIAWQISLRGWAGLSDRGKIASQNNNVDAYISFIKLSILVNAN